MGTGLGTILQYDLLRNCWVFHKPIIITTVAALLLSLNNTLAIYVVHFNFLLGEVIMDHTLACPSPP